MPNRKLILLLSFLLAGGQAAPGDAAKIYKWTDEQGNVSYHDRPPPGDTGKLEEKDIDPDRNVIERQIPLTRSAPARAKTTPAGQPASGQGIKEDESKRPKERGGLSPAEQAAATAEERTQQGGATPGTSATPGPAVPEPPPPPVPPTSGSGVTSGPAVPGAPPPTPGPGGF